MKKERFCIATRPCGWKTDIKRFATTCDWTVPRGEAGCMLRAVCAACVEVCETSQDLQLFVSSAMKARRAVQAARSTQVKIASTDLWPQGMFTFLEMLALVESESSFGAYVCHRRPGGSIAISDLVRRMQDIITDHFAPRGENCCNSNFLRSRTLKFSANDQRTL